MRAETIRRLLVFGVCAVGVSALYLVPGLSHPVAAPARDDRPLSRPTQAPAGTTTTRTADEPTTGDTTVVSQWTTAATAVAEAPAEDVGSRTSSEDDPTDRVGSTPFRPAPERDRVPPAQVASITLERSTPDGATISWTRADDNRGVLVYKVWLNGFVVETTTRTSATVRWFNDDSDQQIVQVRAVDAAGNESAQAASLLARRPAPSPDPTPTPVGGPTPAPSATPSPPADPTPSATSAPPRAAEAASAASVPEPVETPG